MFQALVCGCGRAFCCLARRGRRPFQRRPARSGASVEFRFRERQRVTEPQAAPQTAGSAVNRRQRREPQAAPQTAGSAARLLLPAPSPVFNPPAVAPSLVNQNKLAPRTDHQQPDQRHEQHDPPPAPPTHPNDPTPTQRTTDPPPRNPHDPRNGRAELGDHHATTTKKTTNHDRALRRVLGRGHGLFLWFFSAVVACMVVASCSGPVVSVRGVVGGSRWGWGLSRILACSPRWTLSLPHGAFACADVLRSISILRGATASTLPGGALLGQAGAIFGVVLELVGGSGGFLQDFGHCRFDCGQ